MRHNLIFRFTTQSYCLETKKLIDTDKTLEKELMFKNKENHPAGNPQIYVLQIQSKKGSNLDKPVCVCYK